MDLGSLSKECQPFGVLASKEGAPATPSQANASARSYKTPPRCFSFASLLHLQEGYVGLACSVSSAPASLEQVSWPDERQSYELLHVLGRPSMLAAPAAADVTANISFLNRGDEAAEWAVEAVAAG